MTRSRPSMQAYFTDRLIGQRAREPEHDRRLPPHLPAAAAASRPTRTGKPPSALDIADLDAPLIAAFLDHLERDRRNTIATRNNRLAAIHSLFAYLALHHPEHADIDPAGARDPSQTHRAQPADLPHRSRSRRAARRLRPGHLDRPARPRDARAHDPDRAADLRADRAHLPRHHAHHRRQRPHHRQGKKDKTNTADPDHPDGAQSLARTSAPAPPTEPLFPTTHRQAPQPRRHRAPPRDPPPHRREQLPVDHAKHITMHTLRHTAAMRLLLAGNDITVIALWLGHEQITTTNIYLHADMTHKQQAIDRTKPTRRQTRPLPAPRHAPRLPRSALIMPTL